MNVIGHVTCTGTVAYISATIELDIASSGGTLASKTSRSTGKSFWQDNAATICTPGSYYGYVTFHVNYPPNYNPPVGYGQGGGPVAPVTC